MMVGYQSREDAAELRPGLLRLQTRHGRPIALAGVIAGGAGRSLGSSSTSIPPSSTSTVTCTSRGRAAQLGRVASHRRTRRRRGHPEAAPVAVHRPRSDRSSLPVLRARDTPVPVPGCVRVSPVRVRRDMPGARLGDGPDARCSGREIRDRARPRDLPASGHPPPEGGPVGRGAAVGRAWATVVWRDSGACRSRDRSPRAR